MNGTGTNGTDTYTDGTIYQMIVSDICGTVSVLAGMNLEIQLLLTPSNQILTTAL